MKDHARKPPRLARTKSEQQLDEAIEDSFPASDPLPTNPTSAGGPEHSRPTPPASPARRQPARRG